MDTIFEFLQQPFTWGLLLGLFLVIVTWWSNFQTKCLFKKEIKRLKDENKDLQSHLNTQLKINAAGNNKLETQLKETQDELTKVKNELHLLCQKPGRAELLQLQVMEAAVSQMSEQAPGFAQAWEKAVREAQAQHEALEGGLKKFMRKVCPSASFLGVSKGFGTGTVDE